MEIKIWGKSKNNDKEIPLSEHINDVLKVFKNLQKYVNSKDIDLAELIKIVILYHDAGKVLPYFQIKTLKNPDYQPFDVYANIPHSLFSALMVDEMALKQQLNVLCNGNAEKIDTYLKFIISAIAYHHWRDNFYEIVEGYTDIFERLEELTCDNYKWKQLESNFKTVYSKIDNKTVTLSLNQKWLKGLNNGIRFADYVIPPYLLYRMPKRIEINSSKLKDWILISGFTMLSDHFASYIEGGAEERRSFEDVEIDGLEFPQIKTAIEKELKSKIKSYDSSKIWQFQHVDNYKDKNTILLAPTGMGKTEFSYLWSNGEKFFYTLPLRTAVNQIFNRTKAVFGESKAGILHSDADVYIFGEGGESESMKVYELARNLSYPAIVSTGDQFFPYALRPPAYEKIFAKFSYSRLIIDEVQAYDPKASAVIVKFIEFISQMGGKFLLMTATIPVFIQKEISRRIGDEYNTLNLFEEDADLSAFSKHNVQFMVEEYKNEKLSYSEELLSKIIEKAESNGGSRVLVVMNTVKQAQAVFNDLKKISKNVDIQLFHSRFTQFDRKEKEHELELFIGNNDISRQEKRPKILVATQVVEASLDLDADYLFTELAPWDSMIQRMGRILREAHPKLNNLNSVISKRYTQSNIPENIFVLIYNGKNIKGRSIFESGKGFVYNEDLLRITLKLIDDNATDFEKWLKKPSLEFNKINKTILKLDEANKNSLVNKLYRSLPEGSNYLRKFYNMLQILDAGFMSDRKSDAQKVFREINDVNVISFNSREEFFKKIRDFNINQSFSYTKFKKDILSKYLINVQMSKVKEYLTEINHVPYYMRINEDISDNKKLSKLNNWLFGIYFVKLDYDEGNGLIGVNDYKTDDLFL